jgi:hypothetical protein
MNLEQWANIGELLGGIGVIVSLLYLAFQIRASSRAQRSEAYARSLERLANIQSRLAQDPEFNKLLNVGLAKPEELEMHERTQFTWLCTELFGAFEFMYLQNLDGDLPDVVWDEWSNTIKWWLSFDGVRRWWVGKPTAFSEPFNQLIEGCLRDGVVAQGSAAWNNWLRTGFPEAPPTN